MNITPILQTILQITLPAIEQLIQSKFVPAVKRRAYTLINKKADKLIADLAQNAEKIAEEPDRIKMLAYTEGTKLGVETLRALADKFNKAADEIEKAFI